ncbi:hypothetical protein KL86DPRO_20231 [uncultured delta proteobacterium]|uniref:Type VI secretion system spike protein VgrG3-like C-terminal domain-containing protein n=1 Tax=uncultured delta proteobacterium TaxID=34034 RepID=A0A212JWV5_9DELT|nr:hypothetical protein KL86DPRO_20231 [uncultured delta proteobacterium]
MYSKPLAARMDGVREAPTRVKRGASLNGSTSNGAINFSSFLQQGGVQAPGMPGMGAGKNTGQGSTPMEQAATQNNLGLNQMRALAALTAAKTDSSGEQKKEAAQAQKPNFGLPLNPTDIFKLLTRKAPNPEEAETAIRVASHRKETTPQARAEEVIAKKLSGTLEDLRQNTGGNMDMTIGKLAAQFESGSKGIAAIGYDRHGGTSYGKYQLSSRAGTMRSFIEYCKTEAPDIAERLEKSGGSQNTGGKRGKMPDAWEKIAEEQPDRFEALQDRFIRASHFEPAMRAIAEKSGMDQGEMPFALQEVVFSTAVQHGPSAATRIIARAMDQVGPDRLSAEGNEPATLAKAHENLIRRIYDSRSGQFRSSTQEVQAAVKSRLRQEMSMAITMLREGNVA